MYRYETTLCLEYPPLAVAAGAVALAARVVSAPLPECWGARFGVFQADAEGVANRCVAVAGGGGMCCNQARWMRVVVGSVLVLNTCGLA
jgi:hypothetical protein